MPTASDNKSIKTAKKRKVIDIHTVNENMETSPSLVKLYLALGTS